MRPLPENTISAKYHDIYWMPLQAKYDLVESIKEDERFYNGDQHPRNNPRNFIRITSNHIAEGIRKLASKINGTPLHLSFVASDGVTDCTKLGRMDKYVLSTMGHDSFSLQSAINGENVGTEITYTGFDADRPWAHGSKFAGGLFEKHISPRCFAVSNICNPEVQSQAWLMTWYDVPMRECREVLKSEKFTDAEYKERLRRLYDESSARSKSNDDQNPDKELLAETLIRVYYREFRVNGEVCYTLETNTVPLFKYPKPKSKVLRKDFAKRVWEEFEKKATRTNPNPDDPDERDFSLVEDMEIDFEDTIVSIDRAVSESDHRSQREKFSLYSFAKFTPKVINDFFFGRSLTKEMIPVQKGINYAMSMMLKALENMAYGKVIVREGAMKRGENWSNDPEENVVHDHFRGNGNGYYTLSPTSMPADLFKLAEYFTIDMKDTNGFKDFANGDTANQQANSGYELSLKIKESNVPLEQEQKLFWQYQVDLARIRIMYYKHYFKKATFSYEMTGPEYDRELTAGNKLANAASNGVPLRSVDGSMELDPTTVVREMSKKPNRTVVQEFDPETIWGVDFDVQITPQQGLVESELSTQQWFTDMFGNGAIQAYKEDPDLLEFVIQNGFIPEEKKAAMIHYADKMRNSEIARLRQQVAQLSQALEQAASFGKAQEEQFSKSIQASRSMVDNARAERDDAMKRLSLLQQGRDEGEIKSNNARGMGKQAQEAENPYRY